ncbi:MAG: hypothetical protein LKE37_05030 [Atopobiaceae bacterium]|nr:hypothetical protein [Atopobiaceae bacterium]
MTKHSRHCAICGKRMEDDEKGWVRISPVRSGRPSDQDSKFACPQCAGDGGKEAVKSWTLESELKHAWSAANAIHPLEARDHIERALALVGIQLPEEARNDFSGGEKR